jgi:hypothetical protein
VKYRIFGPWIADFNLLKLKFYTAKKSRLGNSLAGVAHKTGFAMKQPENWHSRIVAEARSTRSLTSWTCLQPEELALTIPARRPLNPGHAKSANCEFNPFINH